MNQTSLRDLTRYDWYFFLQSHSHEGDRDREKHVRAWSTIHQEFLLWYGDPSIQARRSADHRHSVSQRLTGSDWQEQDGLRRMFEARTLLDVWFLQVGQAIRGQGEPSLMQTLVPWVPRALSDTDVQHANLGRAVCLAAQVDDDLPDEKLETLAAELAAPVQSLSGMLRVGSTCLWMVPDERTELVVLLYGASEAKSTGASSPSNVVNWLLPQILLSRTKGRAISESYRVKLERELRKSEEDLVKLLDVATQPGLALSSLEWNTANIARLQRDLSKSLGTLDEDIQTLQTGLRNLESIVESPAWTGQSPKMQVAGSLTRTLEQLQTDRSYFTITRDQADRVLESLHTIAGVWSARWGRRLTLVLGAFGVMGVAQAFPELPWEWRLMLIILGFLVVALGVVSVRRLP